MTIKKPDFYTRRAAAAIGKDIKHKVRLAGEFRNEFEKQLITFITAAFAFVAALFWNNAIQEMIATFVPVAEVWEYKLLTAIGVTLVSVTAIFLLNRWFQRN